MKLIFPPRYVFCEIELCEEFRKCAFSFLVEILVAQKKMNSNQKTFISYLNHKKMYNFINASDGNLNIIEKN